MNRKKPTQSQFIVQQGTSGTVCSFVVDKGGSGGGEQYVGVGRGGCCSCTSLLLRGWWKQKTKKKLRRHV